MANTSYRASIIYSRWRGRMQQWPKASIAVTNGYTRGHVA
jgi:hypothetical protein